MKFTAELWRELCQISTDFILFQHWKD